MSASSTSRCIPRPDARTYRGGMRVRRPEPIDALLIALVLVGQVELWVTRHGSPPISLVVLHLMSPGALLVRRRSPLTATLVTMAAEAAVIQLEQSTLSAWSSRLKDVQPNPFRELDVYSVTVAGYERQPS